MTPFFTLKQTPLTLFSFSFCSFHRMYLHPYGPGRYPNR
jgi:hypothetical protein